MSTIIMSACWPLQGMSAAQKSVLISLADQANDEGVCWPSVARIAIRTCLSERAVQGAVRWLIAAGILEARERNGRSNVYQITPAAYAGGESKEYHYVYKVTHVPTGRFYIGSRTSLIAPSEDAYMGSGSVASTLSITECSKEIIGLYASRDDANKAETIAISAVISNQLCINQKVTNPRNAGGEYPRRKCTPQEMHPAGDAPTPADAAPQPPQQVHPTPADAAPITVKNQKENHQESSKRANALTRPEDVSEQTWKDFLEQRKHQKAPLTATALDGIRREAGKAGVTLEEAIRTCCEAGWRGFRADWYANRCQAQTPMRAQPAETAYQRSMRERVAEACPDLARPAPDAQNPTDFFRTVKPMGQVVEVQAREVGRIEQ